MIFALFNRKLGAKLNEKNKILEEIENEGLLIKADNSGGKMETNEFKKIKILVMCTEDIEISIDNLSNQIKETTDSNNALSKRVWWLNFILTGATIVIAIGTLTTIYLEYFKN